MKIKLLVAAAATVVASSAMAQSAFEGAYGQLGIGFENNTVSSSSATASGFGAFSAPGASGGSFSSTVALGYNFAINNQFLLGIGADYGFIDSGKFYGSNASAGNTGFTVSNRYNIFITPGYAIDKDKLAYIKAGYSSQNIKVTDQASGSDTNGQSVAQGNASGYVLGLGYKQMITGGFYGFGEANYYNYGGVQTGSKTLSTGTVISGYSPNSNAYQFLVGVGYKY